MSTGVHFPPPLLPLQTLSTNAYTDDDDPLGRTPHESSAGDCNGAILQEDQRAPSASVGAKQVRLAVQRKVYDKTHTAIKVDAGFQQFLLEQKKKDKFKGGLGLYIYNEMKRLR